jgi:uncharacterized protein YukE
VKKFNFDQTYREIDVAGEVYKIDFADENLKAYQAAFSKFHAQMEELSKRQPEEMTYEENLDAIDKQKTAMQNILDAIFGAGTFDKLYEKAGRSLMNIAKLLHFVGQEIREAAEDINRDKKTKYIRQAKKRA